jgi:hypothetical protein
MKSSKTARRRNRWRNSPHSLRRRSLDADAARLAAAADLPPVYAGPEPLSVWQTVEVRDSAGVLQHSMVLYVPTHGRCDQHAAEIDGARCDALLTATEIGRTVAGWIDKRPSRALLEDWRREAFSPLPYAL